MGTFGLGDIVPLSPITGLWPLSDFPAEIRFDGSIWEFEPWYGQYEGWIDGNLVAGYREAVCGPEQSRHMYVLRQADDLVFVVDHRETNPRCSWWDHAIEFAKAHPIVTTVAAGGALALLARALRKAS